jgi:MYND finger
MVRFTQKLTGLPALAFAMVCEEYMEDAEAACNDTTPEMTPLFSWLSPYQRLHLTREVMVGLLCPDEPFPPGTVQHLATYYGLVEYLKTLIVREVDRQRLGEYEDIGEDLCILDEDERKWHSEEEQNMNLELIRDRAEKYKRKLDKRAAEAAEEDEDDEAGDSRRLESEEFDIAETPSSIQGIIHTLFSGTPLSREQREQLQRRPFSLNEICTFFWRVLCDRAFQGSSEATFPFPRPLAAACFDFRSNSVQKWSAGIDALFIFLSGVEAESKERGLVFGPIDDLAYVDKSQHGRIQAVRKHVSRLRKQYESTWDANFLAQDQRCIYAVCSNQPCDGYGHEQFAKDFAEELLRQHGIAQGGYGNYQERYGVYQVMASSYQESLKHPLFTSEEEFTYFIGCETPLNYTCEFETITACCPNDGCRSSENLKVCSKCKVVCYCSRSCQVADWPNHKKYCKEMAKLRSDKEAVAAMAKNITRSTSRRG